MPTTQLKLGVTGHRDLVDSDLPNLEREVLALFTQLDSEQDYSFTLVCGVAEGADLLVASVALELGINVEAVLPMPQANYEEDFSERGVLALRKVLSSPLTHTTILDTGHLDLRTQSDRDISYSQLSEYIKDTSVGLVALWNGQINNLKGGTADTVARFLGVTSPTLTTYLELEDIDDHLESVNQWVYWIPAARISDETIDILPCAGETREALFIGRDANFPLLTLAKGYPEKFKKSVSSITRRRREYTTLNTASKLISYGGPADQIDFSNHPHATQIANINQQFIEADKLAIYHQKRTDSYFKITSITTAIMGLLFLIYAEITALEGLLVVYLLLFMSGVVIYSLVKRSHTFFKYLKNRAIAETCRIQYFLALAGTDNTTPPLKAQESIGLTDVFEDIDLTAITKSNHIPELSREQNSLAYNKDIYEHWIQDQCRYFEKKTAVLHKDQKRLSAIKLLMLSVSVLTTVVLIAVGPWMENVGIWERVHLRALIVFFMGLFPVLVGVWEIHQSKMAVTELLWQYRNQLSIFRRCASAFDKTTTDTEKLQILETISYKALSENYLWILQRFHREHEPPISS